MEPAQALPFTAWEQAVFVALFLVFVISLLGWFSKQSDKWQRFMIDIDERWRAFNKEQREEYCNSINSVTESLNRLTKSTDVMTQAVREMIKESEHFNTGVFPSHYKHVEEMLQFIVREQCAGRKKKGEEDGSS